MKNTTLSLLATAIVLALSASAMGGAVAEYWDNMSLSGDPLVVTTVSEINFDWGSGDVPGENSPDAAIPVDKFSCRWTAELAVPVTGTYVLYPSSDDGARMFLNGVQITDGWVDRGTTEDASAALELVAGERYLLVMEMYENGGGAAAYLKGEGPGYEKQIIPDGILVLPEMAFSPSPANGAADVENSLVLTWRAGNTAVVHYVYMGTDPNLVAASDASTLVGVATDAASFIPADLEWETTYYWKVEEMSADGAMNPGLVWSFTVKPQIMTSIEDWLRVAEVGAPTFLATDVADGVYDIGELGTEITYEFLVRSNIAETQVSMCLIGRRFGDTTAGLKYEQWSDTGHYGATVFGVEDYDFGVATNPGVVTQLTFVSSEAAGTTALYVNGVYQASLEVAITLSGLVGIGYCADVEDGSTYIDDFDGVIYGVAVFDRALSAGEIRMHADAYLELGLHDITTPGDVVVGIPNDGDWPAAETPNLAIDNKSGTKFLHFKGETETTGFQVTPSLGATVVTGLTFTTANDAAPRDPIAFELYGSTDSNSVDAEFVLIASGEITDFNQADAWPRYTMNTTAITFANTTAYLHYQVLFTAVRDAASANSMQIAEVELIGKPEFVWFFDDFDSYETDSALHGQAGWKGWFNDAAAGAPASSAYVYSGTNSVKITGGSDLVHEFDIDGGVVELSTMQYIPSGGTGTSYFILLNLYDDAGSAYCDWSVQTTFNLDNSVVTFDGGATATIVYDQWVEVKCVIDLDNNVVEHYYNGELCTTVQWDNDGHTTLQAIDLYANNASPIYYDDLTIR